MRREDVWDSVDAELEEGWRRPPGIFVIAEVMGPARALIHEMQRRFDPKLANALPPHVTLVGSSGVGPIDAGTTVSELRERLTAICRETEPLALPFQRPHRFMQTSVVVLPLDPHGPIRHLHERIITSGLRFGRTRHAFTPHVTLSFHRTLDAQALRELLALRVDEPALFTHLRCSLTDEPLPPRTMIEFPLGIGA